MRELFRKRMRRQATDKMQEVLALAAENRDVTAISAAFMLCALIECYFKDYSTACEYLIELVMTSCY